MKSYAELGQVTLGSQLRMLSEMITADVAHIYEQFGVDLDPKWFPVFYVLASESDSTVTSIARTIGHSHVSVSKIVAEMEARGLIESRKSTVDSRRTLVNLSEAGKAFVPQMQQQCETVDRALDQLFEDTGIDFHQAINVTRRALKHQALSERVRALGKPAKLRIVDFAPKYANDFRRLNVEWITKHWEIEEADKKAIDDPMGFIIEKGGAILMALYEGAPVGCVALIPYGAHTLELAKMGVTPTVQGKGIGLALGEAALQRAWKMGVRRVYLESNSRLKPALSLYEKLGFTHVQVESAESPYKRCDIRMEIFQKPGYS